MVKFCPTELLGVAQVGGTTIYTYRGNQCGPTGPSTVVIQWPAEIPQPWGSCNGDQTNCVELGAGGPPPPAGAPADPPPVDPS